MGDRWPALDAMRGVSIVVVVLAHTAVPGFRWGGRFGVTAFFVLSGFLITSILLRGGPLREFYWRRAARLLPALLLVLAFFAALGEVSWREAFPVLTYSANWWRIASFNTSLGLMGHAWSLAVEEQFYLVWPFLLPAFRFNRTYWYAIGAILLWRTLWWSFDSEVVIFGTIANSLGLVVGAGIAATGAKAHRNWFWVGLVLFLALVSLPPTTSLATICLMVQPAAVAASALMLLGRDATWTPRPLRWLGTVSYGWYLWHVPMLKVWGVSLAVAGVSLVVAIASFYLFERPILDFARHALKRGVAPTSQPGTAAPPSDSAMNEPRDPTPS